MMVEEVVNSYRLVLNDARRMVADLSEDQMSLRPSGLNPPAWILGHLAYSAQMMGGEIRLAPWLPESWSKSFCTGSRPSDQHTYPPKTELLEALEDAFDRLSRRVRDLGEPGLKEPLPDEKCRIALPTIGHAIVHLLSGHASLHVGQLSAWRRAVGLAGAG